MTAKSAEHTIIFDAETGQLLCKGNLNLPNLPQLQAEISKLSIPSVHEVVIDGKAVKDMDSAGAYLLINWKSQLEKKGIKTELQNFSEQQQKLLALIEEEIHKETKPPKVRRPGRLAVLGKYTIEQFEEFQQYLEFVGKLTYEQLRVFRSPKHIRWSAISSVIYRNGYQALPIIALLSLMIGITITYQMGLQLKNYGANIYIVDLIGLSVLREFGPLITAIMVAGRTGSAFTAQLGMMKLNQEIDALNTMGVTPAELLILPRIVGLVIVLPLLTMWANIFGVLGGMMMSNSMLGITWLDFLHRFPHVIPLKTLIIGLGKTPVFALLIASIGCFEGMQVYGGANSVGKNTTKSVVLAIFFIIIADAVFSIIFSKLKL